MGGTIRVILKEEDGKEHRMNRWTNSFPGFIESEKFINKDPEHLKKYMKAYLEMKEDYEKNHESGKFKLNMTDVYLPETDYLGPTGYGLLVIDYTNNKILSNQGYSFPGYLQTLKVLGAFDEKDRKRLAECNIMDEEEAMCIEKWAEEGKLSGRYYDKENEELIINKITREELVALAKSDKIPIYYDYILDMSPWEVKLYDEDKEGYAQMKQDMIEIGFEFTEEDEKGWEEYLSCYAEEQ